jgi:hypothetical protein
VAALHAVAPAGGVETWEGEEDDMDEYVFA